MTVSPTLATTVSSAPLAPRSSALRRFHRNRRGDVLPKVLLTIIALGGVIALASIVQAAMSSLKTANEAATKTGTDLRTVTPVLG